MKQAKIMGFLALAILLAGCDDFDFQDSRSAAYDAYNISSNSSGNNFDDNGPSTPSLPTGTALIQGTWVSNTISSSGPQYYYFSASAGTTYTVFWNDYYEGDNTKTGDVKVSAYWYSDNSQIFSTQDSGYTTGGVFTAAKTGYVMLNVEKGYYYSGTYAIRYTTSGGITEPSAPTSRPSMPTDVSATALSSTSIHISWNPVTGATGYRVYYSDYYSGLYEFLYGTSSTSYTDNECDPGDTWYYKISAYNDHGESDLSSIVYATTSYY
jgi:hypothetical protein